MRPVFIAGIGGLVLGHILWLIGISFATGSSSAGTVMLGVAALVFMGAAALGYLAWRRCQRQEFQWAAFLGALPVLPVIFTGILLGVTYL